MYRWQKIMKCGDDKGEGGDEIMRECDRQAEQVGRRGVAGKRKGEGKATGAESVRNEGVVDKE